MQSATQQLQFTLGKIMNCPHISFDINQSHTLKEWFEFWQLHKHQDITRDACVALCCGNTSQLKALECGAFFVYAQRKVVKSLVVDPQRLKIRVACLVHLGVDFV